MASDEMKLIQRLVQEIEGLKAGLDPDVLSGWYRRIQEDARARAPADLRETIQVIRDPVLTMKFELKASRRAVGYVLEAIDENSPAMPMATRLYFQKLAELIHAEMRRRA